MSKMAQALARIAPSPSMPKAAAGPDTSGGNATGSRADRQPGRFYAEKSPDERAVALLLKNLTLTSAQLAEALGCRPGTLRDKAKCPKLAGACATIALNEKLSGEDRPGGHRRPDDDEA